MSEYQYYEFQAIDRPLTKQEMAELRKLSTRASITSRRFVNEYNYGDFRGNPSALMETYFDAFVYTANWGTHELKLRLPRQLLDPELASRYCAGDHVTARAAGDFTILEFLSENEPSEEDYARQAYAGGDDSDDEDDFDGGEDAEGSWSAALIPLRAELAGGDLRGLYLGWLLSAQTEELDDAAIEPPLPPGLASLSAPQRALADFLGIDKDLIAVAAEGSATLAKTGPARHVLEQWIGGLAESEKDALLLRVLADGESQVRAELQQRFRQATTTAAPTPTGSRSVEQLLAAAEQRTEERRRAEAERAAQERARKAQEYAIARAKYLDDLATREPAAWQQVDALIATKRPADYGQAVQLLGDLRELYERSQRTDAFAARMRRLREEHARKPNLMQRFDTAKL